MLGVMMCFVYDSASFFDGRCPSLANIAPSVLKDEAVSPEGAILVTTG